MSNRETFDSPVKAALWAHTQLIEAWGSEYADLDEELQVRVALDLLDSDRTASDIQRDVFTGNLASYARSLR
jgi:hypothetical protein